MTKKNSKAFRSRCINMFSTEISNAQRPKTNLGWLGNVPSAFHMDMDPTHLYSIFIYQMGDFFPISTFLIDFHRMIFLQSNCGALRSVSKARDALETLSARHFPRDFWPPHCWELAACWEAWRCRDDFRDGPLFS